MFTSRKIFTQTTVRKQNRLILNYIYEWNNDICSLWTIMVFSVKKLPELPKISNVVVNKSQSQTKHKKVLLRERKRHTDCGVSSTTWGGVSRWGEPPNQVQWRGTWDRVPPHWGTPQPGLVGGRYPRWGTPSQVQWRRYPRWGTPQLGYPPARSNGGYPRWGTPQQGVPPRRGTPQLDLAGVPPLMPGPGWGTPPPTLGVDRQTDTCQNITFPSYYVRSR